MIVLSLAICTSCNKSKIKNCYEYYEYYDYNKIFSYTRLNADSTFLIKYIFDGVGDTDMKYEYNKYLLLPDHTGIIIKYLYNKPYAFTYFKFKILSTIPLKLNYDTSLYRHKGDTIFKYFLMHKYH